MSCNQSYASGRLREQWTNATQPGDPAPAGYTAWNAAGTVTTTRALTAAETQQLADLDTNMTAGNNQTTIRAQAQNALVNNRTYLALASPSTAQNTAQVKALTNQVQALIRLALNQFDATN